MRRFEMETDWTGLFDLLCACYRADTADMELYSLNLRAYRGAGHRAVVIDGAAGSLAAYGVLWQGRYLAVLIHPAIGDEALYARLLDWALDTVERSGAGRHALWPLVRSDDRAMIEMLEARGMSLVDTELRMRRCLAGAMELPVTPDGFTIRALNPQTELGEWLELYRQAIGDRPGPIERWRRYRSDPDYRQALDLIAVDRGGALAGACTGTIGRLEARCGRKEGRTEPVMVGADHRGKGLGRALVATTLNALRGAGMEHAALTVEPDNAPAIALYRSLGFGVVYEARWYALSG